MTVNSTLLRNILLAAVLLTMPAVLQAQPYTYTNSFGAWNYTTNNVAITITLYSGQNLGVSAVTVPSAINGLPVTTIADGAFGYLYANDVTSVTIPNTVTSIQQSAFYDCYVTNVLVGNNVTNIGD
jgi:BspA type Leucine rich repeat region (6 copies)